MSLSIMQPGLLTTIQDCGRIGYRNDGVLTSGAMDPYSLRLANLLVYNDDNQGVLEITLVGPTMVFTEDNLIAITGADFHPTIDGKAVPMRRPVAVRAGAILQFNQPTVGCRAYLAVAGGFDVPKVMNSKSTYLRSKIGGFEGRALQTNDLLHLGEPTPTAIKSQEILLSHTQDHFAAPDWFVSQSHLLPENLYAPIRVLPGLQYDLFGKEAIIDFLTNYYEITLNSDRMGYRLDSETPLEMETPQEMISEVVNRGSVQVPPEGQPIVLMADHQTVAGYPLIAQTIIVDTARLAQFKPGDRFQFKRTTQEEAEKDYLHIEQELQDIERALSYRALQLK